jgi:hypothetical protein
MSEVASISSRERAKCLSASRSDIKMNKQSCSIDRGRSFISGDFLIHVSGVVGITNGEAICDSKIQAEKTQIILKNGHPLVDYSVKFRIASAAERMNLYERAES